MPKFSGCLLVLLAACGVSDEDESSQALEIANGVSLNGVSLNGVSLNGVSLNGVSLNGVSLNGVSLNGVSLNGVSLNGVSLNGVSLNGTSMSGKRSDTQQTISVGAIGPKMTATLSSNASLPLRITATSTVGSLTAYTIQYQADTGWKPLCGSDSIQAFAVAGTWNTEKGTSHGGDYSPAAGTMTFACRGKTIAKCVEMGYQIAHGRQRQLETCVRLLRGDYCGDGTPWTLDGQTLNLFDNVNVQQDTEHWTFEAEWTEHGARCIYNKFGTRAYEVGMWPTCISNKTLKPSNGCGASFNSGAVLMSELP